MTIDFRPDGLPTLIGSLPIIDHKDAANLIISHTPEIPQWAQLPLYKKEGMVAQFIQGLPGVKEEGDKIFIDTSSKAFEDDLIRFYTEYLDVTEGEKKLEESRFAIDASCAPGFFELMERISSSEQKPFAVKGQITGPVTMGTGVADCNDRAIFYDDRLRDAMVKLLSLKAVWQVRQLSKFKCPVIIFFDEPALAGFGSSAFISISQDEIDACFKEVISAVHAEGGLAGIHVCANSEWSIILDSAADIASFDAYSFFDRFILYADNIRRFMESGRILAWGVVPTLSPEDIEKETVESIFEAWKNKAAQIEKLGIDRSRIKAQSLITPSCGTGALSFKQAIRVLELTREVSKKIRNDY